MMNNVYTIKELADMLDMRDDTLRTFLDGFRFAQFRVITKSTNNYKAVGYHCTKDFWETLLDYLDTKHNFKLIKKVKNFLDQ